MLKLITFSSMIAFCISTYASVFESSIQDSIYLAQNNIKSKFYLPTIYQVQIGNEYVEMDEFSLSFLTNEETNSQCIYGDIKNISKSCLFSKAVSALVCDELSMSGQITFFCGVYSSDDGQSKNAYKMHIYALQLILEKKVELEVLTTADHQRIANAYKSLLQKRKAQGDENSHW
jgi:hypothetical protein